MEIDAAASALDASWSAPAHAPFRVVICDDVAVLRALVRAEIEEDPLLRVVGEAGDGRSAVLEVERARPDVVLLDLSMPDLDGLEAIPRMRELSPHSGIVVFSGFAAGRMSAAALEAGADHYLEKGEPGSVIVRALKHVASLRPRGPVTG